MSFARDRRGSNSSSITINFIALITRHIAAQSCELIVISLGGIRGKVDYHHCQRFLRDVFDRL